MKFLISEVSNRVGLSQKRIREYEKEGFICPSRQDQTNNRLYSEAEVLQILRIKELLHDHGITVSCLKRLLSMAPCWEIFQCDDRGCPCYKNGEGKCHKIKYGDGRAVPESCKTCAVFRNRHVKPMQILEKVKPLSSSSSP